MSQAELFEKTNDFLSGQIALEDVFEAYYACRKNKRKTVNALSFELDFEKELIRLWKEINSNTYKIGRSIAFIVQHPVQREVFAADFRDRIVHHLVVSKINSLFEKDFIEESYSCREGKGVLYGVKDICDKIRRCSAEYSKDCYILKLDIRSFFMSINKNILYQMLFDFLSEKYHAPDKHIILRLIKQIVFNNPEDNCRIKGKMADWNGLPVYKSLFWSCKHCGLPIGNLTSQIFANFYLNRLDKYIIEELGLKYYGRYVDDFVIIHEDKKVLLDAWHKIGNFLEKNLKLSLHPQKFYLQHYTKGVRFIGAVIKPNRIYIENRIKNNLYQKIYKQLPQMAKSVEHTLANLEYFVASVNSYIGYMRHYNTYNLRSKILTLIDNTFLGQISDVRPNADKLAVDKDFLPAKQKKRQICRQKRYRTFQKKKRLKGEAKDGYV